MQVEQVMVTGQRQAEVWTVDIADTLAPGEMRIRTECSFISAGTELSIYTGTETQALEPGQWCSHPWAAGYANVGIVQAVGAGVTRAAVGQRVFTCAPHASQAIVSQDALVVPVPDNLDPALAAASRMAGVASTAAVLAEIGFCPWVVVFGLGMVGNLAAQTFRIKGCQVIGVDPSPARRALAERCGIRYTVGGRPEEVQQAIVEITGGALAAISVDAVGHSAVVQQAVQATADHGQVILLGTPRAAMEGNLTPLLKEIHLRYLTLRGALEWGLPIYPPIGMHGYATRASISLFEKQQAIFTWARHGDLQLAPLVSHRLRPTDIHHAYEGLLTQPETYTGVVLDWRE